MCTSSYTPAHMPAFLTASLDFYRYIDRQVDDSLNGRSGTSCGVYNPYYLEAYYICKGSVFNGLYSLFTCLFELFVSSAFVWFHQSSLIFQP